MTFRRFLWPILRPRISPNAFFYWHSATDLEPAFRENIEYCRAFNPSLRVRLVDDGNVRSDVLGRFPEIASFYEEIAIPAVRSDIARLMYLHLHGGWYIDADLRNYRSLSTFDHRRPVLFKRDDRSEINCRVTNMAMYFPREHPMLRECLDIVAENAKRRRFLHDVLAFSGPRIVTSLHRRHGIADGDLNSFTAHFTGENPTFASIAGRRNRSWAVQQIFGVMKGAPLDINRLPPTLSEERARILLDTLDARGERVLLQRIFEARPGYRDLDVLRSAAGAA